MLQAPEVSGSSLGNNLDIEQITADYFEHDFGMTCFDNLLPPTALDSIRRYLLGCTVCFDFFYSGGYLGALLDNVISCRLSMQTANEMRQTFPKVFEDRALNQL